MIITITGYPGSGKSTLAKKLAKQLGLKHYSAGDFLREIARKRGMGIMQLHRAMERERAIDEELDARTARLGREKDNFVIDGRVAWHFIPGSVKIFVKVDLRKAAERVFNDTSAGKEERAVEAENANLEDTLHNMQQRLTMNRKRYRKLYGIDYLDERHYNIIVDTTETGIEETKEKVLKEIKQYLSKRK